MRGRDRRVRRPARLDRGTTPLHHDADPEQFEQDQAGQVAARLDACAAGGGSVCLWFSLLDLKGEVEVFRDLGLLDQAFSPPRWKPAALAFQSYPASHH